MNKRGQVTYRGIWKPFIIFFVIIVAIVAILSYFFGSGLLAALWIGVIIAVFVAAMMYGKKWLWFIGSVFILMMLDLQWEFIPYDLPFIGGLYGAVVISIGLAIVGIVSVTKLGAFSKFLGVIALILAFFGVIEVFEPFVSLVPGVRDLLLNSFVMGNLSPGSWLRFGIIVAILAYFFFKNNPRMQTRI